MAQFNTSNVPTQLVGRELSIASSFVKQYYTLLNKAPYFIHNFYSHDSTFIHGTIEMANEQYTEPTVGREKIKEKIKDLNLNDCRAKIKQIDCLESLAGGLVIQVIGELSNNGRPMRRFLQTFVLAPSPDESRQDGDYQQQINKQSLTSNNLPDNRRNNNVQVKENSNPSQNQKFFVLNSIFRYQDDVQENEFENDTGGPRVDASIDNTNSGNKLDSTTATLPNTLTINQQIPLGSGSMQSGLNTNGSSRVTATTTTTVTSNSANAPNAATVSSSTTDYTQNKRKPVADTRNLAEENERLANDLDEKLKLGTSGNNSSGNKPTAESSTSDSKRELVDTKVVYNGTGNVIGKNEKLTEKTSTENGKTEADHLKSSILSGSNSGSLQQSTPNTTSRPPPSNEPKTWAHMVRNAHATSVPAQANVTKVAPTDQQQQSLPQSQQLSPNTNQTSNQQQQNTLNSNNSNNNNNNNNNNNSNNNRRRHMMRKPQNKPNGRSMKNRPPRPPVQQQQPVSTNTPPSSAPANKPIA